MLKLVLIGHIGQDATVQNSNGRDFVSFSVAHTNPEQVDKETGEVLRKKTTYWVSVTTNQLNLAQYLIKGTQVYVEGNFKLRPYRDQNGKDQTGINLSATTIQLLGSKKDGQPAGDEPGDPGHEYQESEAAHTATTGNGKKTRSANRQPEPVGDDLPY